jgi:hypothetical protein
MGKFPPSYPNPYSDLINLAVVYVGSSSLKFCSQLQHALVTIFQYRNCLMSLLERELVNSSLPWSVNIQEILISAGGIISLGIFKKEWSIQDSRGRFHTLIKAAFSKRSLLKLLWPIPGGSASAQIMLNYLYKSEELESALRDTFGNEETLFGCPTINKQAPNKVAIIATGEEDDKSFLLTNYNREWLIKDDESKGHSPSLFFTIF